MRPAGNGPVSPPRGADVTTETKIRVVLHIEALSDFDDGDVAGCEPAKQADDVPAATMSTPTNGFTSTRTLLIVAWMAAGVLLVDGRPARGQSGPPGAFEMQRFGPEDYDGHLQNWTIRQDDGGFIYAANTWGILEYDGLQWRMLDPGIPGFVFSMDVAPYRLYLGGLDQFGYMAPDSVGRWVYHSLAGRVEGDESRVGRIARTHATSDGAFFQAPRRLFYWNGRALETIPFDRSIRSSFVLNDTLFVSFEAGGLAYLSAELPVELSTDGTFGGADIVSAAAQPGGGWVVLTTAGLYRCRRFDLASCRPLIGSAAELAGRRVQSLAILRDSSIAVGTAESGILLFDPRGRLWRTIDETQDLPSRDVKDLFVDRSGGLWAAMTNGIARIDVDPAVTFYGDAQGVRGKVIIDMASLGGRLYMATDHGVYHLSDSSSERVGRLEPVSGLPDLCYRLARSDDAVFAGCSDGVYGLSGSAAQKLFALPSMPSTLYASPFDAGRLYVGAPQGIRIARRRDSGWETGDWLGGAPENVARFHQENRNTLWAGTFSRGVARLRLDDAGELVQIDRFGMNEELPSGLVIPFSLEGRTRFVFGEGAAGLYRMEKVDGRVRFLPDTTFSAAFNASGMEVVWIEKDTRGHYWAAGDARLAEFVPRGDGTFRFEPYPDLQRRMLRHKLVTILATEDGLLWSSWVDRLVRYDPVAADDPPPTARVSIRSLRVQHTLLFGGVFHPDLADIAVARSAGRIRIDYAATDLSGRGGMVYRSRLEGLESEWSPWEESTYREYTNLPAASYTFFVEARDLYGRIVPPSSISFTVNPPWFQTGWAFFLWVMTAGLVLALVMHSYNRLQMSRLQARNAELEKEVAARTAQIRDKQKALEKAIAELNRLNVRLRAAYRAAGEQNRELRRKNKALQAALKALNDRSKELREALEENKKILGITAHDLKNPLSGIIGMTEMMLYDAQSLEARAFREEAIANTRLMKDQAEMMMQIIHDLLDRYRSGDKSTLRIERANLSKTVESVLPWNSRQARDKNIRIHFDPVENLYADIDVSAVQRVVDNLVSNALKYSYPGQNVYITLQRKDDVIRCMVRDEGQGLTEEDRQRVFGKWQRLSARPTAGESSTGLGLYIVRQLVELHGGRVGVESTPGVGACFWFEVPVSRAGAQRNAAHDNTTTRTDPRTAGPVSGR